MKKIMFNDRYALTRAVLEGKKTMTRRIIPIDLYNQTDWKAVAEGDFEAVVDGEGDFHDIRRCGTYKVGEIVTIAQRYSELSWDKDFYDRLRSMCDRLPQYELAGWDNKMFVKADLMPHSILITDVKVERLQDITDWDCIKEGIYEHNAAPDALGMDRCKFISYAYDATFDKNRKRWWFDTPKKAFAALMDKVSGKGTWKGNPWVFAYTFELIR